MNPHPRIPTPWKLASHSQPASPLYSPRSPPRMLGFPLCTRRVALSCFTILSFCLGSRPPRCTRRFVLVRCSQLPRGPEGAGLEGKHWPLIRDTICVFFSEWISLWGHQRVSLSMQGAQFMSASHFGTPLLTKGRRQGEGMLRRLDFSASQLVGSSFPGSFPRTPLRPTPGLKKNSVGPVGPSLFRAASRAWFSPFSCPPQPHGRLGVAWAPAPRGPRGRSDGCRTFTTSGAWRGRRPVPGTHPPIPPPPPTPAFFINTTFHSSCCSLHAPRRLASNLKPPQ